MITGGKQFLLKHGFKEDADKKILSGFFRNGRKLKEVSISIYGYKPFMLLARSTEKKVTVEIDTVQDTRLIFKKKDRFKTAIIDILVDEISNCMFKEYENGLVEFTFELCGLGYSLNISV